MDFLRDLGALALASRLRRLTDRLTQDVSQIYRELDIDFEPRWFPVYYLLSQKAPLGVVDIAKVLGVSHPAVNQIAGEMINHGLVQSLKDETDKRKRLLCLTEAGLAVQPVMREIWDGVYQAVQSVLEETDSQLLNEINQFETAVQQRPIHQRFLQEYRQKQTALAGVEIIPYEPAYKHDFQRINQEWIERYFVMEPEDKRVLNNPEETILKPGGHILFARLIGSHDIVGTCALLKEADGSFELAKMGVTEQARGKQIGKQLLAEAIETARKLKAPYIHLETNSNLKAAINLYTRLGFVLQSPDSSAQALHYERGDTLMRLTL